MSLIKTVIPHEDFHLEILLDNGCSIHLNLEPKLHTVRFNMLSDKSFFNKATTDGVYIYWESKLELSIHEVFQICQK